MVNTPLGVRIIIWLKVKVKDMYEGAITHVKSSVGLTQVSVGLYQGYSLIPYISPMIMDVHVGLQDKRPISVVHDIYADDIVLCGTRREED